MALQPSIRVINGKVFGAYAAQAKNVAYGQGTVEDALDELEIKKPPYLEQLTQMV